MALQVLPGAFATAGGSVILGGGGGGGAGVDTTAIHVDQAGEISGIAAKATPVGGDFLVIEDSEAADAKKSITLGDLPASTVPATLAYAVTGDLTVAADLAFPLRPSVAFTIEEVFIEVKTAPTDANIIVDVNKNGTTIFTTQGNRPEITAGSNTGTSGAPDVTALAKDDAVTIDVDQVGSTIAGADLVVMVRGTVETV